MACNYQPDYSSQSSSKPAKPRVKCKVVRESTPDGTGLRWINNVATYYPGRKEPEKKVVVLKQPQSSRNVMGYTLRGTKDISYYYTDRYPYYVKVMATLTLLCCICGSPLTLLCMIPMIILVRKAKKHADNGDIDKAVKSFSRGYLCLILVVASEILLVILAVIGAIVAGIVVARVHGGVESDCDC